MKNVFNFYQVCAEDKRIINNLADAFRDNDRMKVLLGKKGNNFFKKMLHIISYSYFMVKKIGGLFMSKDQNTYLLFYTKSKFYFSLRDALNYVFIAFYAVGIKRLKKVYLREKRIKSIRQKEIKNQKDKDYLYVWFIAQKKGHQSLEGPMEAKKFLFKKAKTLHLPIYMETTEKRLVHIYERLGFKFYDCLKEQGTGLSVWFGRYC